MTKQIGDVFSVCDLLSSGFNAHDALPAFERAEAEHGVRLGAITRDAKQEAEERLKSPEPRIIFSARVVAVL